MKKNLKTIVMLSLALISIFAVTFAFSGAWFTDSDSKTATITVGKKVEITVDATVPEDTTIMPGGKIEIENIVGVAAADVSNMYVRASVKVANTYANVLTPTTTSTGWVKLDGYFYYSSADSLTADSTLSNLTELVAGNSTSALNLELNVSEEATQEPTDETYLAPGATVTVTITFEAIQSANTDTKSIKDVWGETAPEATLDVLNFTLEDGTYSVALKSGATPTTVVIPETYNDVAVTKIPMNAFANCSTLTSVVIPDSVTYIGDFAFQSAGLTSIQFPTNLEYLGAMCFWMCWNLSGEVYIPATTAFYEPTESVQYVNPFSCTGITAVNVDSANPNLTSVDGVVFDKNITKLICYPSNKADTTYTVPNTVNAILADSMRLLNNLKELVIPASVTKIGSWAIDSISLETVKISAIISSEQDITSAFGGGISTLTTVYIESQSVLDLLTSASSAGNLILNCSTLYINKDLNYADDSYIVTAFPTGEVDTISNYEIRHK